MTNFSKLRRCLMLLLCLSVLSCASKPVRNQVVTVSGVGTNLQEAKNDAIRQGIQVTVGSYVTSDLEVSNETVTRDNVTDYAGAIVDRFEILNQFHRPDGLYELTARMWIAGDGGRQRNRSAIASPGVIDGQSLHAEVMSRFKLQADNRQIWENTLANFPQRAFQFTVVQPNITTVSGDNEYVTLSFYTLDFWRRDFLNELRNVLKHTAHPVKASKALPYGIYWINGSPNDQQTGLCLMQGFRTSSSWQQVECYIIDLPMHHFEKWLCSGLELTVDIQGKNNKPLAFQNRDRAYLTPYIEIEYMGGPAFIFYIVDNEMINDRSDYQKRITEQWKVDIPVNVLPDMKNISARAECS